MMIVVKQFKQFKVQRIIPAAKYTQYGLASKKKDVVSNDADAQIRLCFTDN